MAEKVKRKKIDEAHLIDDVRHLLDEQELVSEVEWVEEDSLPIGDRIRSLFPGAWNNVQLALPVRWTSDIEKSGAPSIVILSDTQKGTGVIEIPEDVLRVTYLKMKGWKRGVSIFIDEMSGEYVLQQNYAMRGGVCKPVVALIDSGAALEYFSLPRYWKEHQIESLRCVCHADSVIGNNDISERGYKLLTLVLARDTAASMNRDIRLIEELIKQEIKSYGQQV